jgi:hypothetical protein
MGCACSFLGDPADWSDRAWNAANYNQTAPTWYSWFNVACSTLYAALCEIPLSSYVCPEYPPPAPSPPPAGALCECRMAPYSTL